MAPAFADVTAQIGPPASPAQSIDDVIFQSGGGPVRGDLRVTQLPVEVAAGATANLRVTQLPVEVVADATANLRVTQVVIEVVVDAILPAPPQPVVFVVT